MLPDPLQGVFYATGNEVISLVVKLSQREANHSPQPTVCSTATSLSELGKQGDI